MKKSLRILLASFVGSLCVSLAHSATLISSDFAVLPNDTNTTVYLAKFDTTLGELTGIYVEVGINLSGVQVQLDNDDVASQIGTGRVINIANSLTSDVSLLKTGLTTINTGDLGINASQGFNLDGTTTDPVGQFDNTGLGDYANWEPGDLNANGAGNIHNLVWSQYEGTGTFGITTNATYITSATFAGSNGYFEGNTASGEFYANVTYTYDAIPEPSAPALLGVAALGLACLRRRRK
jgi:MYXO-CTERM domain-containing protein